MKISIIIPAYNTEKYVYKCLTSVLSQDLSEEEFEIILVDDGSSDNTSKLACDILAEKKNKKIIFQSNQRQGAARNNALKVAKGEYIWFVDSDDYVEEYVLRELYEVASENKLDVLFFHDNKIGADGKVIQQIHKYLSKKYYEKIHFGRELISERCINMGPCYNLIKKELLEKYSLKFIEGVLYEDNEFMLRLYYYAERVLYLKKNIYYTRINPNSSTRSLNSSIVIDIVKVVEKMIDFSKVVKKEHNRYSDCNYYLTMVFNSAIMRMKSQEKEIIAVFIDKISKMRFPIAKAMVCSKNIRYFAEGLILFVSPRGMLVINKYLR